MKNKIKGIRFNDKMLEKIKDLMEDCGYPTITAVIHQALIDMHKDQFPAYVQAKNRAADIRSSTPLDRSLAAKLEKENKLKGEREERIGICLELEGKIIEDMCHYTTHSNRKSYNQEIPLDMITKDLIGTQYYPDKETVLKLKSKK
ncbi:MAG: hypothetical protein WC269_01435 [Candidatus Gracilibacteria bacterium]|jgi:hypothetical protein